MSSVMSYLHPHIVTSVVDNSAVIPTATVTNGTALYMPYVSDRGVDGVIECYTSYSQFIMDKGTPNFKRHGQPIYNILQFLNGGGIVYCMRIMPEDAEFATGTLSTQPIEFETTIDTENPDGSMTDDEDNVITTVEVEPVQLAVFKCKGRGAYGNRFRVDVKYNKTLSAQYGMTMYDFMVYENNKLIEGPFYCALDPYATNSSGTSLFLASVINRYSNSVICEFDEDKYDELVIAIGAEEAAKNILTTKPGEIISISLEGGKDGHFEEVIDEESPQEGSLEHAYIAAYGKKELESKRFYPIDVLLDAGFSGGIRKAILSLAELRGDCMAFCDCPNASPNAGVAGADQFAVDTFSRTSAFYCQRFVVYDPFTRTDMDVSMCYFLAYKIPYNDSAYGMHMPLAGAYRGVISGFKSMNYNPIKPEEKETLYLSRVNYAEQDYRQTKLMSQLTAQETTSALSNINNMRVLLRMIRVVEEISEGYYFEFANATTLNNFQAAINNYLQEWTANGACTYAAGTVYQNDYDIVQKIVRVNIELIFTGIIERISITFNVGN